MSEWIEKRLGEVCSIKIGGTPSRSKSEYWDVENSTTNYWVSIRDLNRKVIDCTAERITDLGALHSNAKLTKAGTVLLSFKLTIGKVGFAGCDLYTNEAIAALETDKVDNDFLYYGLQHWDLLQNVDTAIKGATLNKEKLDKIRITLPADPAEQARIARILSTVDAAIEETEALIAKYNRIRTGLMQDLLTRGIDEQGRIRSEETHAFKDSPLGRVPVEWEVVRLEKLCTNIVDCPHSTPTYQNHGVLVARTMHIKNGYFDELNSSRIPDAEYSARISRLEPEEGDIIFTREAPVGEAFVIPKGMKICLGQRVMLLRPNHQVCQSEFLLETIYSPETQARFRNMVGGTTAHHVNVADIKSFWVKKPSLIEQERILKIFAVERSKAPVEVATLQKLQTLKKGLMQDLLAGPAKI